MKSLPLLILILLLSGCSPGRLTVNEGKAKFSIPFDFPNSQKQSLQEKKMLEEMERLKGKMAQDEEESGSEVKTAE